MIPSDPTGSAEVVSDGSGARRAARGRVGGELELVVERRERPGSIPSAAAVSQSANAAFLGSSGPCR